MNLIKSAYNESKNILHDWAGDKTKTIPDTIDFVTYDQYETNNPLRLNLYNPEDIKNPTVRKSVGVAHTVGSELVSAYVNPFYLTHKIVQIPNNYQKITQNYKKYSQNNQTNSTFNKQA